MPPQTRGLSKARSDLQRIQEEKHFLTKELATTTTPYVRQVLVDRQEQVLKEEADLHTQLGPEKIQAILTDIMATSSGQQNDSGLTTESSRSTNENTPIVRSLVFGPHSPTDATSTLIPHMSSVTSQNMQASATQNMTPTVNPMNTPSSSQEGQFLSTTPPPSGAVADISAAVHTYLDASNPSSLA